MKTTALLFMLSVISASAQNYYGTHLGNFDYWYGPNGYHGIGQHLGNGYYYHDNYGSGYGNRLGNFDFYNYYPYRSDEDDGD